MMPPLSIRRLEIHVADGCNFHCESCSHFSNPRQPGLLSPDEADWQMGLWNTRLLPHELRLLGGEPTLNPNLTSIVSIARTRFPASNLEIVSNGLLLHQHPQLPETLLKTNASIWISVHSDESGYKKLFAPVRKLAEKWSEMGIQIKLHPSDRHWTQRYRGSGSSIEPLHSDDPRASWKNCQSKVCTQLRDGCIWKCPMVAYLPLHAKLFPELSADWNMGLKYTPLSPSASDDEVRQFFSRQEEPPCGLCPANPTKLSGVGHLQIGDSQDRS